MAHPTDALRPVIVLAGTTSGLAVVRSLGERGVPVVVADFNDHGYAGRSRHVRESIRLPDSALDEPAFTQALEHLARRWAGALLVPGSDDALVALARARSSLEKDFVVGTPTWKVVRQVIEKRYTYELAATVGVPAPRTLLPDSLDDVRGFSQEADYPCLVKPSQSHLFSAHFGTKMFVATDAVELVAMYRRSVDAGLEVLLQEYIPGDDTQGVNYNCYRVGSRVLVDFTAAKVRNAPPSFGSPRVTVSRRIEGLGAPAAHLLEALGLQGFSCTEFKRDPRDGTYKLMEVNARHNLSAWLAVSCGVDFPWMEYRHRLYGEEPAAVTMEAGVYWIDVPSDIKQSLRHLGKEPVSALDFVRPYARRHVFAVGSLRDPRPLAKRLMGSLRRHG